MMVLHLFLCSMWDETFRAVEKYRGSEWKLLGSHAASMDLLKRADSLSGGLE